MSYIDKGKRKKFSVLYHKIDIAICTILLFIFFFPCAAEESLLPFLYVGVKDLRLIPLEGRGEASSGFENGFDLLIKKKDGMGSVLLTETTRDPSGRADNYAYRAEERNDVNGDEVRMLDGKELHSQYSMWSLVDSTPEYVEGFGECFRIRIPHRLVWGYPWARNGEVEIGQGTFINIRAFEKPYADYSASFRDNPYMFDLGKKKAKKKVAPPPPVLETPPAKEKKEEKPLPPPIDEVHLTDDYSPEAAHKFDEISDFMIYSKGPETIVDDLMASIDRIEPKDNAEIVFAIDTTGSMKDDIQKLRDEWVPRLIEGLKRFNSVKLGLILYRDYGDAGYNYKGLPVKFYNFTSDIKTFERNLNSFKIHGNEGGDVPEAVYEGLYASLSFYKWSGKAYHKVILIGDAEPHPVPRGSKKYTKDLVMCLALEKKAAIDAIIVPDDKTRRGRK